MRCLSMGFASAPLTRSWVVDRNCLLNGAMSSAGNVAVSSDPSITTAAITAASATSFNRWDILLFLSGGANVAGTLPENLKIPLEEGKTIYVACSATAWVFLFLEDVPAEIDHVV